MNVGAILPGLRAESAASSSTILNAVEVGVAIEGRRGSELLWMKILGGARDWVHRFLRQESTQEMRDAVHVSRLQKAAGSYMTLYIRSPSTAGGTLPASSGARRPVFYTEIPRYDERRLFSVLWRTMPDVEEIRVLVGSESARAALPKVVVAAAMGLATSPGRIGVHGSPGPNSVH